MSIIIPNMKMPMSCTACPLAREMFNCLVCVGYFKDNFTGRRVYKSDLQESDTDFNRPDWCPLVPLPEGHGRLGDLDALFQVIGQDTDRWLIDDISYIETDDAISAVYKAPTIVPAEGGTDNG